MLQAAVRSRKARKIARVTFERRALQNALQTAKQRAADAVDEEFARKESLPKLKKIKWAAKVRMYQVKARTKGLRLSREQCVEEMKAEQIAVLWKKILKRFEMMAMEKNLTEEVVNELRDRISSKSEPPPPLPKSERKCLIIRNMQNEKPEAFVTGEEEDEARLRLNCAFSTMSRKEMMSRLRQLQNFMTNQKAHNMLLEFPSKRLILDKIRDLSDEEALEYFTEHLQLRESVAMDLVDSLRRLKNADLELGLIRGRMIQQLHDRDKEMQIMIEENANRDLKIQKQRMTRAVAMAKAQEDPEKAMEAVNRKVNRLMSRAQKAHRVVSKKEQAVAQALNDLDKAKRESRRLESLVRVRVCRISFMCGLSLHMIALILSLGSLRTRSSSATFLHIPNILSSLSSSQVRIQRAASNDARALSELKTITPQDRCDWIHRYSHCQKLPEKSNEQIISKYQEVLSVLTEFKHVSETYAKIIVSELYMPEGHKLLNIKSKKKCDFNQREKNVWELRNIRFVVALDYHGMYNGNDAAAMKAAGNALRASREYSRCTEIDEDCEKICVPLKCNVDYLGFRVTCTAIAPLDHEERDKDGKLVGLSKDFVYGILERGIKILNRNAECASGLKAISKHLNLMQHAVKGEDDMTLTYVEGATDLQIFKGADQKFYPLRFERAFPPEDTKQIDHFKTSSRGMAVIWRLLRPEIVRTGPSPLSPDSYSLFSDAAGPDQANVHDSACDKATTRLLRVVIPAFAEELCSWPGNDKMILNMSWSREMHSRGINLRHLGLLRSMFWHELSGRVSVTYSENRLQCENDWRIELPRDSRFKVRVEHQHSDYKEGFRLYVRS